jgi:hypothetical protein
MKILIGNTGLIGTTLKDSVKFDYEFNSSNINELINIQTDTTTELYLACLPATKWKVNLEPQKDLENIFNILNILSKKQYGTIVLYSTIDVYYNAPVNSDESYELTISAPAYGSNRLIFEKLITSTLSYQKLLVLRLPALFGKHIKKNILYDLLHNNNIDKINYNSEFQWYNLNDIDSDTTHCLNLFKYHALTINLFTEPIHTSDILKLFDINKKQVDTKSPPISYNFKTTSNLDGYVRTKTRILHEIQEFVNSFSLQNTNIAVCLFGEPRDILNRIDDWKRFSLNFNVHFYLAFYSNESIHDTITHISNELAVKSYYVTDNDLSYFNELKYKAADPIMIHTADYKATFSRITSQCFIRQKATSLVEMNNYDVVMLCRSDVSNFFVSYNDILNVSKFKDLLVVNSGTHVHAGGGGGCVKCSIESKCDAEFHYNDICDWWCMGSPEVMSKWNTFYDNVLENYHSIQKTKLNPQISNQLQCIHKPEDNETMVVLPTGNWSIIENDVHCFYPEKLMRVSFQDDKILSATHDKLVWK